jgi:signal transduction histidine kinase
VTVRVRTALTATAVVALALLVGAGGLLVAQRRAMLAHLEDVADVRASDVAALVDDGTLPARLSPATEDDDLVRVVADDGTVIATTPGYTTAHRRITTARARGATVFVATSDEPVDDAVRSLARALLLGGPLLLVLVGATTWTITGRALRPVERIRAEVATISERSLDTRVPVPDGRDEVARLASTMNTMLDRIERSVERQRRFVADASHDLRTPLASMRADLEVACARPEDTAWPATAAQLLATTGDMERLVSNLLFLARADAGVVSASHPFDLDDGVLEEVARTHEQIDTDAVSGAEIVGRRDDVARVVRNLLDNAVRHASSRVAVAVAAGADGVALTVTDDGPGIPRAERDRVFDRFVRVDDARSRSAGGAGLGLAIAREIVESHGGRISIDDADAGTTVRVVLP